MGLMSVEYEYALGTVYIFISSTATVILFFLKRCTSCVKACMADFSVSEFRAVLNAVLYILNISLISLSSTVCSKENSSKVKLLPSLNRDHSY